MTVRVTKEDRKRIDHIKEGGGYMPARIAKELVLDDSYKDINRNIKHLYFFIDFFFKNT